MKTSGATYSLLDKDEILRKINELKSHFPPDWELPNVYLLHGDMDDKEMKEVKLVGCPNDAVEEVKNIAHVISSKNGGNGAVREFCEYILEIKKRHDLKLNNLI